MHPTLLPGWLRYALAAALLVVAVLHARHAGVLRGQSRWWHAGHTVMAVGMTVMYLVPMAGHDASYRAGLVLFAVLTLGTLVAAVSLGLRERRGNPLWLATVADLAAMTYMFAPMSARPAAVTWLFVAYLAGQTLAWAFGLWQRVPMLCAAPVVPAAVPAGAGGPPPPAPEATPRPARVGLPAHRGADVRATLAVMAAGMAYMLLAMR